MANQSAKQRALRFTDDIPPHLQGKDRADFIKTAAWFTDNAQTSGAWPWESDDYDPMEIAHDIDWDGTDVPGPPKPHRKTVAEAYASADRPEDPNNPDSDGDEYDPLLVDEDGFYLTSLDETYEHPDDVPAPIRDTYQDFNWNIKTSTPTKKKVSKYGLPVKFPGEISPVKTVIKAGHNNTGRALDLVQPYEGWTDPLDEPARVAPPQQDDVTQDHVLEESYNISALVEDDRPRAEWQTEEQRVQQEENMWAQADDERSEEYERMTDALGDVMEKCAEYSYPEEDEEDVSVDDQSHVNVGLRMAKVPLHKLEPSSSESDVSEISDVSKLSDLHAEERKEEGVLPEDYRRTSSYTPRQLQDLIDQYKKGDATRPAAEDYKLADQLDEGELLRKYMVDSAVPQITTDFDEMLTDLNAKERQIKALAEKGAHIAEQNAELVTYKHEVEGVLDNESFICQELECANKESLEAKVMAKSKLKKLCRATGEIKPSAGYLDEEISEVEENMKNGKEAIIGALKEWSDLAVVLDTENRKNVALDVRAQEVDFMLSHDHILIGDAEASKEEVASLRKQKNVNTKRLKFVAERLFIAKKEVNSLKERIAAVSVKEEEEESFPMFLKFKNVTFEVSTESKFTDILWSKRDEVKTLLKRNVLLTKRRSDLRKQLIEMDKGIVATVEIKIGHQFKICCNTYKKQCCEQSARRCGQGADASVIEESGKVSLKLAQEAEERICEIYDEAMDEVDKLQEKITEVQKDNKAVHRQLVTLANIHVTSSMKAARAVQVSFLKQDNAKILTNISEAEAELESAKETLVALGHVVNTLPAPPLKNPAVEAVKTILLAADNETYRSQIATRVAQMMGKSAREVRGKYDQLIASGKDQDEAVEKLSGGLAARRAPLMDLPEDSKSGLIFLEAALIASAAIGEEKKPAARAALALQKFDAAEAKARESMETEAEDLKNLKKILLESKNMCNDLMSNNGDGANRAVVSQLRKNINRLGRSGTLSTLDRM